MKKYTAQHHKKQFVLISEGNQEIGRIVDASKTFHLNFHILFSFKKYEIKKGGLFNSNLELLDLSKVVYFTDVEKERIIKSGDTEIYTYKLGRKRQLFHKGKLLIEIRRVKKWFKDPVYYLESDDCVNALLLLFFLFHSDNDFNTIDGGD